METDRPVFDGDYQKLKEETAATLWMKIEEKAEINQEEPEEDKSSFGSYLYSLMKVVLTVFVLILTVAVLFRGWPEILSDSEQKKRFRLLKWKRQRQARRLRLRLRAAG